MNQVIKMKPLFLDNASTTPVDSSVFKEIKRALEIYANPSSKHELGEKARDKIEESRGSLANYLSCDPSEIIFTSGGTEGNNLIIRGLAEKNKEKKHILVSEIEHPSVLESAESLKKEGFEVEKIKVDSEGIISLEDLKKKIRRDTLLVSVMHVNNEIGTIQPIEEIAGICRREKVYFHSDMVQSLRKIKIDLKKIGLDFATFSGHKINTMKGIGFVFIKKGIQISPIIYGGGQERGIRNGTENFVGIVSLAKAIRLKENERRLKDIQRSLIKAVLKIPGSRLNGSRDKRVSNNLNFSFYGIEGESIMLFLSKKKIYVSTGSACNSSKLVKSHVLNAIGVDELYINGSIRITFDIMTKQEVDYFLRSLKDVITKLQKMSPFKLNEEVKQNEKRNKEKRF